MQSFICLGIKGTMETPPNAAMGALVLLLIHITITNNISDNELYEIDVKLMKHTTPNYFFNSSNEMIIQDRSNWS